MSMRIENCTFTFKCPTTWEQLSRTDDRHVRFCGQCARTVHLCATDDELTRHARDRHCVAVRRPVAAPGDASVSRQGNRMVYDVEGPLMVGRLESSPYYHADDTRSRGTGSDPDGDHV